MTTGRKPWRALALAALMVPFVAGTALSADMAVSPGYSRYKMWLACENGRDYPIRPLAISREYDLVTGYMLWTGSGRGIHMRLVPMGVGYRYEGGGIWFDGLRGDAVLNWGRPNAIPCKVMQETAEQ